MLDDLLIEFDEMGYAPTTFCTNSEEQVASWKKRLIAEVDNLVVSHKCQNIAGVHPVDGFVCSRCGFMTEEISQLTIDEDTGRRDNFEFEIKFCPNCGSRVED